MYQDLFYLVFLIIMLNSFEMAITYTEGSICKYINETSPSKHRF